MERDMLTDAIFRLVTSNVLAALAILAVSLVVAKFSGIFIEKYLKKITEKTGTTLDDGLLTAMQSPVFFAFVIFGAYAALLTSGLFSGRVDTINRTFYALWVALAAFSLVRIGRVFLSWASEKAARSQKQTFREILNVVKYGWNVTVVLIALLMILDGFGLKITPLLASLGIAGLAVALAFQDTLMNFFAGVFTLVDQPVRAGDYIRLDTGDEGYVEKIGWRSTRIRTFPNNIVIVPNSKLAQSIITNYYSPAKEMGLYLPCSVAYGSDLKKVEKVTVEVAKKVLSETKGGMKTFEPYIRYNSFGDSGIGFSVILRVESFVDKYLVTHEFVKALHERYLKEGIEIPYPKRHVYMETLGKKAK